MTGHTVQTVVICSRRVCVWVGVLVHAFYNEIAPRRLSTGFAFPLPCTRIQSTLDARLRLVLMQFVRRTEACAGILHRSGCLCGASRYPSPCMLCFGYLGPGGASLSNIFVMPAGGGCSLWLALCLLYSLRHQLCSRSWFLRVVAALDPGPSPYDPDASFYPAYPRV